MKLNDWNEICLYGMEICKKLKAAGYEVNIYPYKLKTDSNRRGINLQVLDCMGNVFQEYSTGVWNTIDDYEKSFNRIYETIMNEL